jgi:anaerobic magnesium-protoporphyrin IX monomethyl ester cyclase
MNLLINPTTMVQSGYTPPPLGLLDLAAMDPDTVVFDAALHGDPSAFIRAHRPALVGATMYTPGRHESIEILRVAKEVGARTVAGGPHVATMTDQLARTCDHIDHLVIGDGELAWKALCSGEDLPRVIKMPVTDLDELPMPRWSAVNVLEYPARGEGIQSGVDLTRVPRVSVVLGRGCTGHCTFCSTWWVNGKYRAHGRDWMQANLQALWDLGVRHLVFQDDCLTADRRAVHDLCDVLSRFQFAWFGTTRADLLDLETALRLKACGCYELSFGIETGSPQILARMNKQMDLQKSLAARAHCARAGIRFTALMMAGFPFETPETQAETMEFMRRLRPDGVGVLGFVMVLPGTVLYKNCKARGLVDDDFWLGSEPYYVYSGGLEAPPTDVRRAS